MKVFRVFVCHHLCLILSANYSSFYRISVTVYELSYIRRYFVIKALRLLQQNPMNFPTRNMDITLTDQHIHSTNVIQFIRSGLIRQAPIILYHAYRVLTRVL